jgi:hypothetical protein
MKSSNFIIFLSTVTAFLIHAQEIRSFQENGLFGFKKDQRTIIAPQFTYASEFYEGSAVVQHKGKWGFILGNGAWLVEPEFDNAQPFYNGFALVYKGGKYGLIDLNGKQVVPIAFNKIVKEWDGFLLIGDKQGYFNPNWDTFIPAEYDKIDHARYFSVAKKGKEYVVYHDGKMLAKTEYLPQLTMYNHAYLDMRILDGIYYYGIMDTTGAMIVPQVYTGFQVLNVLEYHVEENDPGYFYVYELDSTSIVFDDVTMEYYPVSPLQKRVLNAQLQPIHPGLCRDVAVQEGVLQLIVNDQLATLQSNGKLKYSKYRSFQGFAGRIFATGKEGVDVLSEKDSTVLAHFGSYYIPTERAYQFDPETGEETMITADLPYPLIEVSESLDLLADGVSFAFYDPLTLSFITAYSQTQVKFEEMVGDHTFTGLILRSGENNFNYWIPGMKPIESFPFTYLKYVGGQFFMASEGEGTFLFSWLTGKRFPLDGDAVGVWSTSLSTEYFVPDEASGEGYWMHSNPYDVPFVRLDYGNGKYGVIDLQERFYFGPFDSIVQIHDVNEPHNNYLLQVYDGELCGMINLLTGEFISPRFQGPLNMKYDMNAWNFYALEDEIHPRKYISSKGMSLDGLPEEPIFYKEKGKMGGRIYAPHKDTIVDWIPPVYKTLNYTEFFMNFQAQDTRTKKWGMLDLAGDTLVPFMYDHFGYREMSIGMGDFMALELYSKKKLGLYHPVRKKIIPAIYDKIYSRDLADINNSYLIAIKDGKNALYASNDFTEILPCEYDGIWIAEFPEREKVEVRLIKNGKTAIFLLNYSEQIRHLSLFVKYAQWYDLVIDNQAYSKISEGWIKKDLSTGASVIISELKEVVFEELETTFEVFEGKIGMRNEKGKWIQPYTITSMIQDYGQLVVFENGVPHYLECYPNEKECHKYNVYEW